MTRTRIWLFLLGAIVVPLVSWAVILVARGYRPNLAKRQLLATGLLVASSVPDGAQILVDGQLKSATNATLNLPPGSYRVEIKKSGFSAWQKTLAVEAEVVTRAAAVLFPSVPSLKAITSSGADRPLLSPDGTKVAFLRSLDNLSQIYVLDLTESALGLLNRDARLVSAQSSQFGIQNLIWSPDSKQILSLASPAASLVDTAGQQPINVSARVGSLIAGWKQAQNTIEAQKFSTLPSQLQEILATAGADLVWSPAENKLLYTATASATIPDNLIKALPGSSSQPQSRNLEPGKIYVYDLVEDRNFASVSSPAGLVWFPTSAHLLLTEPGKVSVVEYDGQNPTVVYAGPMEADFAGPYPSGKQLLILTNLNPQSSSSPNLYAVSLR